MPEASKRGNVLQFLLLFIALYLGMQLLFGSVFPQKNQQQTVSGPTLTSSSSFTPGNHPILQMENRPASTESFGVGGWVRSKWCSLRSFFDSTITAQQCAGLAAAFTGTPFVLKNRCPEPSIDLYTVENPGTPAEKLTPLHSAETVIACEPLATVAPGETVTISLAPWKYSLFEKVGTYEARIPGIVAVKEGTGALTMPPTIARFSIVEPGVFTKAFRTFISAPFLNFLIFIASFMPGYNLGIAIILLTLAVKILLFFPTQHALEGQKKMQMLQPKLEALKARYHGDAKKIQEETMKLWTEHKINPFQSCLPMVIQFPVLIGLFYVIRDGSDLSLSRHLIYGVYQNLPWHFGTHFLWLDLLKPDYIVMPLLLVALQFLQMKLTFSLQKRKKAKEAVIDVSSDGKPKEKEPMNPQDMQQKMMLYGLPLMIGVFAFQFPSAVALYWGVSTLFGIGQQMIVNREHLRV